MVMKAVDRAIRGLFDFLAGARGCRAARARNLLFDRHALGQVARLVDVAIPQASDMVGQ